MIIKFCCKENCSVSLLEQPLYVLEKGSNLSFSVVVNHIISLKSVYKQVQLLKSVLSFTKVSKLKWQWSMSATCNCERRLGVAWGPDPDWDPLTRVWVSTDTRGLNLYPLTSCCVQNHLWAPCVRSAPLLDRSNTRIELLRGKNKVIGIERSPDDTLWFSSSK